MNTFVLTSVAILAGVAARPIHNNRRSDDLHELVRSPNHDDRQAPLGGIPDFNLNSLQLHNIHDQGSLRAEDDGSASTSPKLGGADGPSNPDPGLDSPYIGPQRYLPNIGQDLEATGLLPISVAQSSQVTAQPKKPQPSSRISEPDYSPLIVPLVFASLAALVLLGLTVAVVCVTQVLRRTVLRYDVWRKVAKEKDGISWSEKEKVGSAQRNFKGSESERTVAARELPRDAELAPAIDPTKSSDTTMKDQELIPLPENLLEVSASSGPPVRHLDRDGTLAAVLVAWTYDNWIAHFMVALFGWFGVLLRVTRVNE